MNPSTTPHDQTLQRLPMYRLGLLSESDEAGCRLHLETCEACRAALAFMEDRDDEQADDGPAAADDTIHIPASILARWPAESARLRGAERSLYREHLASCATCAGALRILGHAPELTIVPELEAATPQWARIADAPAPESGFGARPAQSRPVVDGRRFFSGRSTRRLFGLLTPMAAAGAIAVLAPVAAVMTLVAVNPHFLRGPADQPFVASRPQPGNHLESPSPATPPAGTSQPPAAEPNGAPARGTGGSIQVIAANRAEAIPELLASRGATGATDLLAMTVDDSLRGRVAASPAGEFAARLEIPASLEGAASDETVQAELSAPGHAVVARGSFRVAGLFPRKALFVTLGQDAEAGIYSLRLLSPGDGPGAEPDTLVTHYFIQPIHR